MPPCKVCSASASRTIVAREMMFGMRDQFAYAECAGCGSLQLVDPPADLAPFYPPGYYSFAAEVPVPAFKHWIRNRWYEQLLGRKNLAGALLARLLAPRTDLLALRGLPRSAAILDVGSGAAGLLSQLAGLGFDDLTGVDPYLDAVPTGGPVRLFRATLAQLSGKFDAIVFNHSIEHLPDPRAALQQARDRLLPGGRIVVRTPVVGQTWRQHGSNWVELDAPRHLFIFSEQGLRLAAAGLDLRVDSIVYDSTGFELWGTRLYELDIPLTDPRSPLKGSHALFSRTEMKAFERAARRLNEQRTAGRLCAVLRFDS